ncbi:MAG TPA: glycosyltransferase family 4 protein, partial [Arenibaculum sp.]|nr:glycosyltransferase family 4 protein [Arenibaculum sp.]
DAPKPRFDYLELARTLAEVDGWKVDILDAAAVEDGPSPYLRGVCRILGLDKALTLATLRASFRYDAIISLGDPLAVSIAMGHRLVPGHCRHVTTFISPTSDKKRLLHRLTGFAHELELVFVHTEAERRAADDLFQAPCDRFQLIPMQVDHLWYRPSPTMPDRFTVGAAGVEFRDYATLVAAATGLPDMRFVLNPQSPWSRKDPGLDPKTLPPNVVLQMLELDTIRDFYDGLSVIAVPLLENDTAAGLTAVLQGMAMGKPVVCTRTAGRASVITDGVNGLLVEPGDLRGWHAAILALRQDPDMAARLGTEARRWIERHATMEHWVSAMREHLRRIFRKQPGAGRTAPAKTAPATTPAAAVIDTLSMRRRRQPTAVGGRQPR